MPYVHISNFNALYVSRHLRLIEHVT